MEIYSNTPKNQDDRDLVGLNVSMMNDDANQWDMVTDPPQNPQTEADSSDDRVKEMDVSGGQTSLKITFDKQTPEEVKRGVLSEVLLASIRLHKIAIGSINSGSDMNPNMGNVIDHTLTKAVIVINTVADVGSLGSDISN